MKFTEQQGQALKLIERWLRNPEGPQVFRLFGYAGTGKTTLARYVEEMAADIFGKRYKPVVYGTYTGKAALVLTQKGCDASTIHSLIYKPVYNESGGIKEWVLNQQSPVRDSSLVCIDEVSMVNEENGQDLLSFGTKTLVLGDPFQLQPVSGSGYFTNEEPDYMLTDIRRQALDNPIIFMATHVRNGKRLLVGRYGTSRVTKKLSDDFYDNDQIIVGANKTRRSMNATARRHAGFETSVLPVVRDKVICLRNDKRAGLINGGMWTVLETRLSKNADYLDLSLESLDLVNKEGKGRVVETRILKRQFAGDVDVDYRLLKGCGQFDFGNVITGHKSQGSQWDSVGAVDESDYFEEPDRWRYTVLTRAVERVTIIKT